MDASKSSEITTFLKRINVAIQILHCIVFKTFSIIKFRLFQSRIGEFLRCTVLAPPVMEFTTEQFYGWRRKQLFRSTTKFVISGNRDTHRQIKPQIINQQVLLYKTYKL